MTHPFAKMFEKALKKSTIENNVVLVEAEKLRQKGYRVEEIAVVLQKLRKSLIDKTESEIVGEAEEEFERYLNSDEENED